MVDNSHDDRVEDWRTDLGPLAGCASPTTRDLVVDGDGFVWIDDGSGFHAAGLTLSATEVRHIGVTVVNNAGGRVDDARPIGDAALAGKVRAHVVLPPVARKGPLLSLRFPSVSPLSTSDFTVGAGVDIRQLTESTTLVAGLTGSGKSTLVSALIDELPDSHRVVIVEDIAELNPRHPHTVHLATRAANADGGGAVHLSQLVKESLRMRPDSLVVGEIRGDEIRDFFAATTAGHHGLATIHAHSLNAIPTRLTTLALLAGIPRDAIAELATASVGRLALCTATPTGFSVDIGVLTTIRGELRAVAL